MVWNPSGTSAIRDHARAHCVMKVKSLMNEIDRLMLSVLKILKGSLKENLYEMPPKGSQSPPRLVKEAEYTENQVMHIYDQIAIHKISNSSATEFAVSLHLSLCPATPCQN
jgi:cysteine dioxygenase